MPLTPALRRAARGLLDWTQDELAPSPPAHPRDAAVADPPADAPRVLH